MWDQNKRELEANDVSAAAIGKVSTGNPKPPGPLKGKKYASAITKFAGPVTMNANEGTISARYKPSLRESDQ